MTADHSGANGRQRELERLSSSRRLTPAEQLELEELRRREDMRVFLDAALERARRLNSPKDDDGEHARLKIRRAFRRVQLESLERSQGLDAAANVELEELKAAEEREVLERTIKANAFREAFGYAPIPIEDSRAPHQGAEHRREGHDATRKRGQKLRALREECGWTVERLAEAVGLDKSNVQDHLTGKTIPRLTTLRSYADAFTKEMKRTVTVADLKD